MEGEYLFICLRAFQISLLFPETFEGAALLAVDKLKVPGLEEKLGPDF